MIETNNYKIAVHRHDGPYENFLYLITDKASGKSVAIDPAWDAQFYKNMATDTGGEISCIWLTHTHFDHVNAVEQLRAEIDLPLYISTKEAEFWEDTPSDANFFDDGDTLHIGDTTAKVFVTPGHSPGSCCFLLDQHLIAGDTLFTWGCGRCDLPGSSPDQMFESLARLAADVPDEIDVLPGHDYGDQMSATMAEHRAGNPFILCKTVESFTRYRMETHDKTRSSPYHAMRFEDIPQ